jgi:hypothetical protein
MAVGGPVPGNSPTDSADDINTALTSGEWVIKRKSARKYGSAAMNAVNEGRARIGYAAGGEVHRNITTTVGGNRSFPNFNGIGNSLASTIGRELGADIQKELKRRKAAADAARAAAGGGDPGGPAVGGGRGHVTWKGGTFTERFRNTLIRAQRLAGTAISVFQGGFSRRVAASGASHYGDAIDAQWNPRVLSGLRRARVAAWHRTPAQGFIHHIHGVPLPGAGFAGGSGVWQAQDYLRGGDGLARGAVVRGGRGGITTRIGEGRRDELVAPLPKNWENLVRVVERGGSKQQIVSINVSFPNYVGDKADLKRALVDLNRGGHLDVIKRVA